MRIVRSAVVFLLGILLMSGFASCQRPESNSTRTPTPTPGVVVVSSNVFVTESSLTIDGESRRLNIVAELRNDCSHEVRVGDVSIRFYDAYGNVVCKRLHQEPLAEILSPGDITAVVEWVPSGLYVSDETNDFPENWTTYEITLPEQRFTDRYPADVTIQDVDVTVDNFGTVTVTGSVLNTCQERVRITPYVILYGSGGRIINAAAYIGVGVLVNPGQSEPFEINFYDDEPNDYTRYVVDAYAICR